MLQQQEGSVFSVRVSYLELYNEKLGDLLYDLKDYDDENMDLKLYLDEVIDRQTPRRGATKEFAFDMSKQNLMNYPESASNLKIVEDPVKGVVVQNLLEIPVAEASDLMDLIAIGNKRRQVANTGANRFSSRSHAILIFHVEGRKRDESNNVVQVSSKLQMIDLAGSERAQSTENRG